MARRGHFPRRSTSRRQTSWFNINIAETAVASGAAVLLSSLTAVGLAFRPFTVIRSRGVILVSDATAVTMAAFAIEVVDETQITGGIGVIPTPLTEADSDEFFVYEPVGTTGYQIAGAGATDVFSGQAFPFDSKAMRKVGIDESIAMVVENQGSGNTISISVVGRMLIKLH